ncbi:MAG TPA: RDD family protein [Conexivisphaerales archaeon]|nr:RDD family protein [Conexivisphaerales archaeon]
MTFCTKCGRQLSDGDAFCPACGTPVARVGAPSAGAPPPPQGHNLSGIDALIKEPSAQSYWIERLVAFVIDWVVVTVAVGIIAGLMAIPWVLNGLVNGNTFNVGEIFGASAYSFLNSIIVVLYFAFAESIYGTTLGKSVMGLKVETLDGRRPTLEQTFIRDITKINWVLLLLDVVFGLATSTEYRQKFSDRYAKTLVVKRR